MIQVKAHAVGMNTMCLKIRKKWPGWHPQGQFQLEEQWEIAQTKSHSWDLTSHTPRRSGCELGLKCYTVEREQAGEMGCGTVGHMDMLAWTDRGMGRLAVAKLVVGGPVGVLDVCGGDHRTAGECHL